MAHRGPRNPKRRVAIDFPSEEAAAEFFRSLRHAGLLPKRAGLYYMDSLDRVDGGGVTLGGTLIARSGEGRPDAVVAPLTDKTDEELVADFING